MKAIMSNTLRRILDNAQDARQLKLAIGRFHKNQDSSFTDSNGVRYSVKLVKI